MTLPPNSTPRGLGAPQPLSTFPPSCHVYLSTIDVYPCFDDPRRNRETTAIDLARLSRYGLHKHLAEQIVRKYAASWLICRLGGMVGAGMWKNSIYDILHGRPLRVHAESEYQFMNTDDVAKTVLTLVRRQPENDVFNVCGRGLYCVGGSSHAAGGQAVAAVRRGNAARRAATISMSRSCQAVVRVPETIATVTRSCAKLSGYGL